ncbi:MAG TPA: PAS domain-containing protein [Nitrospirae bacterium]|nr:PAS domain-containing protein [Nitrospirota bacterium]
MLENLKYRDKIIFLLAVVLLLTSISLVFLYSVSRKNLIEGHNKRLDNTAQLTINTLTRDLENVEKVIHLFEENRTLTEYLYITNRIGREGEPLEELSSNIIDPLNFSLLALYDKNGKELVSVDADAGNKQGGSLENIAYLSKNKNISGYSIENGNLRIVAVGTMHDDPTPYPESIRFIKIGANIDAKYLSFLKELSGNDIFIVKEDNIFLSSKDQISSFRILENEMETDGIMYSIKSIPLKSMYGEELASFIIALPKEELASSLQWLRSIIILMAIGSMLVSGLLGIMLIKTLTSPLNRLIKLTEQVGSGKFPEEKSFEGIDEVSVLGRHFLDMTKKLKNQKKALATYTTGLEDAVMNRTQELFNSREEWISTFNSITDYVLIVDREYRVIRANRALLDRLEMTNQELAGKKCFELFCGKNSTPDGCPIHETLDTGKPSMKEINYSRLVGHFLVAASPLSVKDDEITGIVYVVKDITERHNLQLQMINAEKLASMGQMAAGFAHEINNPMTAIAGCTELLIDQLDADELQKIPQFEYFHEYLNIIYREAFRCKDIIRGMLRFSRKQYDTDAVDINSLIKEILSLLDHIIKSQDILVIEDYGSIANSLMADEGEIRQIMLALIVNAIDAMPAGGSLTVRTFDSYNMLCMTVSDTGLGVPVNIRNRIFEPFFTTKPVGKGTGLGLFIAFNLAKKYHGKIELVSSDNRGATFTVTFPLINPAVQAQ